MNVTDILEALRTQQVQVTIEGDDLVITREAGPVSDDLLAEVRRYKPELLDLLAAAEDRDEPLHDPATEARRQKVLAMLAQNPSIKRAIITDTEADPENVIVTIGLRSKATAELLIQKDRYDPFLILKLIEAQSQEPS